jgi:hypothetical protein
MYGKRAVFRGISNTVVWSTLNRCSKFGKPSNMIQLKSKALAAKFNISPGRWQFDLWPLFLLRDKGKGKEMNGDIACRNKLTDFLFCFPVIWKRHLPAASHIFFNAGVSGNGRVSDNPRRLPRHQRAQAHNSTHYRRQLRFMYWLCSKQNCLLCAYEHDFGDNYIMTCLDRSFYKKNM